MFTSIFYNGGQKLLTAPPVMTISGDGSLTNDEFKLEGNAGILFITTYPPRECGIATYSQDLITALNKKFGETFTINVCPVSNSTENTEYGSKVAGVIYTDQPETFSQLAENINSNDALRLIVVQHEFGLFENCPDEFVGFLRMLQKPVVLVFHTVLSKPSPDLLQLVKEMTIASGNIIVMTNTSANILMREYAVPDRMITVIPHGTHLVQHEDKKGLKKKYRLSGHKILTTFGLLSSGKGIETTLDALPAIIKEEPTVLFLVIGKTHPTVVKTEGERYRNMLQDKVKELGLEKHVLFINYFLQLPVLLDYLQLTDIYLFTSKNPGQAVSGTFAYAISCGCPVVSTPIPHAVEVLKNDGGVIIDFGSDTQLSAAVISLLHDDQQRQNIISNGLHRMASTAWENSAVAHAMLFKELLHNQVRLVYTVPPLNTGHIRKMTTETGMIQFARLNKPDLSSGYTLDDNARGMIATCHHYELTGDMDDLKYIGIYLQFIRSCQQPDGQFLNYMDARGLFTDQNNKENLEDSNGRAVWALGFLVSRCTLLPGKYSSVAFSVLQKRLSTCESIHSSRAMAFIIKGLYYKTTTYSDAADVAQIRLFADRLVQMYRHESDKNWNWFESYMTYANSILPEALLCAWLATGNVLYKEIARASFDFLLSKTFRNNRIAVISNKNWLHDRTGNEKSTTGGEQPIDVAYTIMALKRFYDVFREESYYTKMTASLNWFLGDNHLHQIMYNPCTGGCYDGLEESYVNLNQGAESAVSYLMARLTIERGVSEYQQQKEEELRLNNIYETQYF